MDKKAQIAELEKELRSLESGGMQRVSASGRERTKDVSQARIAELKAKIAKLKKG
jgi:hypothetical protein